MHHIQHPHSVRYAYVEYSRLQRQQLPAGRGGPLPELRRRRGDDRPPPHERAAPRGRGGAVRPGPSPLPALASPGPSSSSSLAAVPPLAPVGDDGAQGLVDLVDAAVVDAVDVAVGLLLCPLLREEEERI